jgi:glyoxylase-like metal-dependent hydrolase (beta-lactamase superfamily II)
MANVWTVTRNPIAPIHTFTAPEDGWLVTSHIIELPTSLLVVDAQYTLTYAREVVRYAEALKKPLAGVYVTHYHPDHLLGAAAFDAPLYALPSVAEKIAKAGDRVAREEHEKMGDVIPNVARRPDRLLTKSEEVIEGVRLQYRLVRSAETENALVIAVPDARAIIVQDLVYNRSHLFLGEKDFDGWRAALREYRALPYDHVLPGHGLPGDVALYDEMIAYLDFAESALKASRSGEEFRGRLIDQFPDHGCHKVLNHQLRFLFPPTKEPTHA